MRSSARGDVTYPFFHVARQGAGATALFVGSTLGVAGAHAQTADQPKTDRSEPEEIVVTGQRSVVNEKLGGSVQDAPMSINIVSAKTLQEESVTNMQDALKNIPGITLNAGEGTARGDSVNLRGFPAFNDFFFDGIRDAGIYTRDVFDLETLEVLKGPAALLFGRGSTGGVINQVSKAAQLNPIQAGTLQFGTNEQVRGTGDLDMAVGPSSAFRFNFMAERSGVTDRDNVLNRRWGIAPTFTYGINEPDTISLSWLHQEEDNRPEVGIPFLNGAPAPVPRGTDFGLLSDYFKTSVDILTLHARHEFNDDFSVTNTFRGANYRFNNNRNFPNFGDDIPTPTTPLSKILVGRDAPYSSGIQQNLDDQLDFRGRFETGFVTHDLTVGLELSRETNDLDRYNNPFNSNNDWIPRTPLLNPDPSQTVPYTLLVSRATHTAAHEEAAYFTDTAHVGQYVDLIAGVRYDRFDATFTQDNFKYAGDIVPAPSSNFGRTDNITSPRFGLVVKPTPNQSYYFSYGTSFDPSAEALSLTAGTSAIGPVKAQNYEVGAKLDWLDGKLSTTAALFRTEITNAQINDPEHPGVIVLAGNQKVDGVELNATGHLTEDWEILAGFIYLDPRTVSNPTPGVSGRLLINSARAAANLWTEYYLDDHWEVGTGLNFLGRRYADLANTASIPSYWVWNGMVEYKLNESYSLQMNITNITDENYYDNAYYTSPSENHITPGAGRTFTFVARANF
ncbi:MAG TPA: TonB-dependent siderophore receptor [Alphaproteobacteria bacterium]|jgi:catecholate siderophore receptor|nr:TonB-dependent siderophore receptor [Alphaproteobacteria bacterium]